MSEAPASCRCNSFAPCVSNTAWATCAPTSKAATSCSTARKPNRPSGAIAGKIGRPVGVLIRTARQLQATLDANPFPQAQPSQVGVVFLPTPLPAAALDGLVIPGREEVRLVGREAFVHYPDGIGRSKLKLPFAAQGTTRNLNTVASLLALAGHATP
jgi:uncharacterized protein (DUF1697 family)